MEIWGDSFAVDSDGHEGNYIIKITKSAVQISRNHFSYERIGQMSVHIQSLPNFFPCTALNHPNMIR